MKIFYLSLVICVLGVSSLYAKEKPKEQPGKFQLLSPAFENNGDFPKKYTCSGGDINPPFQFLNVPAKAQTLALTMHDPDAPEGVWVHWVNYNILPDKTEVAENTIPGYQSLNDFGKYNYSGPCPPDEKIHHYVFRTYAVDTILEINEGMTMKDLEKAMNGHVIAKSELVGVYRKPIW